MNWLREMGNNAVVVVRQVEPSFLTEETSAAWKEKEASAAKLLESAGENISTTLSAPLLKAEKRFREETPTRQLKQSSVSRTERLIRAINSLSDPK